MANDKLHKTWVYNAHGNKFGFDSVTGRFYRDLDEYKCGDITALRFHREQGLVCIVFDVDTLSFTVDDEIGDQFYRWLHKAVETHHYKLINDAGIGMVTYKPAQRKDDIDIILFRGGKSKSVRVQYKDATVPSKDYSCDTVNARRQFKVECIRGTYITHDSPLAQMKKSALRRNDLVPSHIHRFNKSI